MTKDSDGEFIAPILRGYQKKKRLRSHAQVASALGVPETTLANWYKNTRCPKAWLDEILPHLGGSLELARRTYAPTPGVEVYASFADESENVFLNHFEGASTVHETRIGLVTYPAEHHQYRADLNATIYRRLSDHNGLKILKVEQISCLERAVDLAHNVRTFSSDVYEVRAYPYSNRIPYMNFSIFDSRSVIAGGFHKKGRPNDPFIDFFGEKYVMFFERYWAYLWNEADEFSVRENFEDLLLRYVREIPGCESISDEKFEALVDARAKNVSRYATRY